jgi:hypothetical protein
VGQRNGFIFFELGENCQTKTTRQMGGQEFTYVQQIFSFKYFVVFLDERKPLAYIAKG